MDSIDNHEPFAKATGVDPALQSLLRRVEDALIGLPYRTQDELVYMLELAALVRQGSLAYQGIHIRSRR